MQAQRSATCWQVLIIWDDGNELGEDGGDIFPSLAKARAWAKAQLAERADLNDATYSAHIDPGTMVDIGDEAMPDVIFEARPFSDTEIIHP